MAATNFVSTMDGILSFQFGAFMTAMNEARNNRTFVGLPTVQAILGRDAGLGKLIGARGIQSALLPIGQMVAAATAEGTDPSPTTVEPVVSQVTVARRVAIRDNSDYANHIGRFMDSGQIPMDLARKLIDEGVDTWSNTLASLFKALAPSVSTGYGTSGADLTFADVRKAVSDLQAQGAAQDGLVVVLDQKGYDDFVSDLIALGGAVAQSGQAQQPFDGINGGYVGRYFRNADFVVLHGLATSGTDTVGLVFGSTGVQTRHEEVEHGLGAQTVANLGPYAIEALRPVSGSSRLATTMYNGAALLDPNGARKLIWKTS